MSKITEVERFLQQHTTVGSLRSEQWAEAGDLQRKLAHRVLILKILWHAEPDEAKFHSMSDWITVIEDEVRIEFVTGGVELLKGHCTDIPADQGSWKRICAICSF